MHLLLTAPNAPMCVFSFSMDFSFCAKQAFGLIYLYIPCNTPVRGHANCIADQDLENMLIRIQGAKKSGPYTDPTAACSLQ